MIDIRALPIHLDGSDGSMWASRDTWDDLYLHPDVQTRRFVRVSDLLLWLEKNNYPTMELAELLALSIQNVAKSKQEQHSASSDSLFDKTGLSLVPTDNSMENKLVKFESSADSPDGPSQDCQHETPTPPISEP
jgi:hypothetical protein